MSKIIRTIEDAPVVFIGEQHRETLAEQKAERTLKQFFPFVSFITTQEGAKLIPIQEIHKVQKHVAELCDRAAQEGYQKGHDAGLDEGREDARKVIRQFEGAVRDAVGQREALLQDAKQHILELVVKVTKKVTCDTLRVDPELALSMISRVIDQLADRTRLKIKVHPDFLPIIEQETERLLAGSTTIKDLTFEADSRVKLGGCFIETPSGDIDARLESQFEVIEEALLADEEES
ncbi:MAG: hypothetical protein JSU65_09875 [Candidatus Zixiibacteriota bacterium]|nr:MAG: hypothetical protein JSU65_09875 [candidate division Zixibacteria bacterium]